MMKFDEKQPLMIQSNLTILLESDHPAFAIVRKELASFAELVKSPIHLHTYRMTPLSLWNAASTGKTTQDIVGFLHYYSKYEIPLQVESDINRYIERYGMVRMEQYGAHIYLTSENHEAIKELISFPSIQIFIQEPVNKNKLKLIPLCRGLVKQECIRLGYPI